MTKVRIEPGICGFVAQVTAELNDDEECEVTVTSGCQSVQKMMEALGDTFDPMEVCLTKPGQNIFYEYAGKSFPVHAACPVINGILKCIEAEASLALKKDSGIYFIED